MKHTSPVLLEKKNPWLSEHILLAVKKASKKLIYRVWSKFFSFPPAHTIGNLDCFYILLAFVIFSW